MSTAREILSNGEDGEAQSQLLLKVLSDIAADKDVSIVVSAIIQDVIASGAGNPLAKKLAFDICRAAPLTDANCAILIPGIKTDILTGQAESQGLALEFIPSLPAHHLCTFVEQGDVSSVVEPHTRSSSPRVRAAAVSCLAGLLLVPEVLAAVSTTPSLASAAHQWCEAVLDALVDSSSSVVTAGICGVSALYKAASSAAPDTPSGMMLLQLVKLALSLLGASLGPVLVRCQEQPSTHQVAAVQMLKGLVEHSCGLLAFDAKADDSNLALCQRASNISAVGDFLLLLTGSINAAVRMEAANALLEIVSCVQRAGGLHNADLVGLVSPSWQSSAVSTLIALTNRQMSEPAVEDIVLILASHLDDIGAGMRVELGKKLISMCASVSDTSQRMKVLALIWQALLRVHMDTQNARLRSEESSWGSSISSVLDSHIIREVLGAHKHTLAAAMATVGLQSPTAPPPVKVEPSPMATGAAVGPSSTSTISLSEQPTSPCPTSPRPGSPRPTSPRLAGILGSAWGSKAAAQAVSTPSAAAKSAANSTSTAAKSAAQAVGTTVTATSAAAKDAMTSAAQAASGAAKDAMTSAAQAASAAMANAAASSKKLLPSVLAPNMPDPASSKSGGKQAVLKLELVCTLLEVLRRHFLGSQALQMVDSSEQLQSNPTDPFPAAAWQEQHSNCMHWLAAASAALMATQDCLTWEPLVNPGASRYSTGLPSWAATHFTTLPADCWLQLLQLTARATNGLLRCAGFANVASMRAANDGKMPERLGAHDNGMLANALADAACNIQLVLKKELRQWSELSRSVRPRLLWVAAQHLELVGCLDETWTCLLTCLEDLLVKAPTTGVGVSRSRQLEAGVKAGRMVCPTRFPPSMVQRDGSSQAGESIAGSALVELYEQLADGITVGMQVLQHLTYLLDDCLVAPDAPPSLRPALAPIAAKLKQIVRRVVHNDSMGLDTKGWCRRLSKTLVRFEGGNTAGQDLDAPLDDRTQEAEAAPTGNGDKAPGSEKNAQNAPVLMRAGKAGTKPWGYPFAGPRFLATQSSQRAWRHTWLQEQLEKALTLTLQSQAASLPSSLQTERDPPHLGSVSSARLNDEGFWRGLDKQSWQQISGPSDPLVLSLLYRHSREEANVITCQLKAYNRLSVELDGVEVSIRPVGSLLVKWSSAQWKLDKLLPREAGTHQIAMRIMGFSHMEIHCRVQFSMPQGTVLDPIPPVLNCQPVIVSMMSLLQPPSVPSHPAQFFQRWSSLPLGAQLTGVCTWPGVEGSMFALSALERQPLQRVWVRQQPMMGAWEAAYVAETRSSGACVLLLVSAQIMPLPDCSSSMRLLPGGMGDFRPPAWAMCSIAVRSNLPEVVSSIQSCAAQFMDELTGGSVVLGFTPPMHISTTKPWIHPNIIPLFSVYKVPTLSSLVASKAHTNLLGEASREVPPWVEKAVLEHWQSIACS